MTDAGFKESLQQHVGLLLSQGYGGHTWGHTIRVGSPLPIANPDGSLHSWFVPLQLGKVLVGFAQILGSLVPMRFSSFQRRPDSTEGCPDVADWIDPNRILERAREFADVNESLSDPVLTYDQVPSRIAWRVNAVSGSAKVRALYVVGSVVYESAQTCGLG